MILQLFLYGFVVFGTLYCFFLYDEMILTLLLVAELVYLPISLGWLWYLKKRVQVSLERVIPLADKNQKIPVEIGVKNISKIPNVHVKVLLQVENHTTGERQRKLVSYTARRGKKERVSVELQSSDSGNLMISIKAYWVYDMLFLLRIKGRVRRVQRVGILPECHLLPVEVTKRTREFLADAEEYSDRESGDDPSEIYQIREYREGDSIHDVHWKLSAKADDLLVKEFGRPKGSVVLIWLNLQTPPKGKRRVPPVVIEAVASLSMSLLEEDCVHMVAWYEAKNKRIQKKRVSKEAHVYELLDRLLYTMPYQEDVTYEYEEAFRGISFSTIVEFGTDGKVLVNGEEKTRLSLNEGKQEWDTMYFVV